MYIFVFFKMRRIKIKIYLFPEQFTKYESKSSAIYIVAYKYVVYGVNKQTS